MSSCGSVPCPICFETETSSWHSQKVRYASTSNHSWGNHNRCDGHNICWGCLSRHIEVQVCSEGKCSIRCPGEGCRYHLLFDDVRQGITGLSSNDRILETLIRLSNQSCQDRLKELVLGKSGDESANWVLSECQPCPKCFVLARRETGCSHIVCRCGCHFCFGCGAPSYDHEEAGCFCDQLHEDSRDGEVFFAAWLRTAYTSPCEWLWEASWEEEPSRFITTLGFWLWVGGANVTPPLNWEGVVEESTSEKALRPLTWTSHGGDEYVMESYDSDTDYDDDGSVGASLGTHVRRVRYAYLSTRMARRVGKRARKGCTNGIVEVDCDQRQVAMMNFQKRGTKEVLRSKGSSKGFKISKHVKSLPLAVD